MVLSRFVPIRATFTIVAVATWSGVAHACPFCSSAKAGSGYLIATVVLLVMPVAALAGFALWVRRCTRAIEPADGESESSRAPLP